MLVFLVIFLCKFDRFFSSSSKTELYLMVQILILHQSYHQILICFSLAAHFHLMLSVVSPIDFILPFHHLHLMLSHHHCIFHLCFPSNPSLMDIFCIDSLRFSTLYYFVTACEIQSSLNT